MLGWEVGNAIDHYHRYKEDVALMKWMGLDAYRFSISWSRILPTGKKSDGKNEEGVKFYRDLIDELHKNGIEPYVTLFHWDVPQGLEDEYGGFRDRQIVEDYKDYVDICFTEFGQKVKHWITFNEPWSFSEGGYATSQLAPGRGDVSNETEPSEGDPAREPYIVTHHQLLAHAKAVELYRTTYKKRQKGEIGIALNSMWIKPASDSDADKNPVTVGKYPTDVEQIMKSRKIDTFTATESAMLKGSIDFLGINYYTSVYARNNPGIADEKNPNYTTDSKVEYPGERLPLGENWGAVIWLRVHPQGLKELLIYIKSKYNGPIYITENGFGQPNNDNLSSYEAIHDAKRVSYHHLHLCQIRDLTDKNANANEKVNVIGYFAWSLWDNFEWASGFDTRFGNIYVDFKNNLKRTPKFSAHWFKYILQRTTKKGHGIINTSNFKRRLLRTIVTNPRLPMGPSMFASSYGMKLLAQSSYPNEVDEDSDLDPARGSIDDYESNENSDPIMLG
ncbi:hypothetical protein LguiA_013243 [Lonicera macranthoides]